MLQEFKSYYKEHIGKVVDEGRVLLCHLTKHGWDNSLMPTNNLAEAGNAVMQELIDWHSKPMDAVGLTLLRYCDFLDNEITASRRVTIFLRR